MHENVHEFRGFAGISNCFNHETGSIGCGPMQNTLGGTSRVF